VSSALTPPMPGKNKYVVWNPEVEAFDEFPIKIGETLVGNFLEIIVAPPVKRAGFLSHKKQIFQLSIHDLLRNHFNVTKPYITTASASNTNTGSTTTTGDQPTSVTNQRGSPARPGDELDQESSLYWEEQTQSLLNSENSEEGWIMEEIA
jgi:hypothetical protein